MCILIKLLAFLSALIPPHLYKNINFDTNIRDFLLTFWAMQNLSAAFMSAIKKQLTATSKVRKKVTERKFSEIRNDCAKR